MVMFASSEDRSQLEPVRPPPGSKIGERVYLEGDPLKDVFSQDKQPELKPKKKYMENFLTLTKSNDNCDACYNGVRMVTSAGPLKVYTLKNATIS
mmetsp:Transcript_3458/g.5882  ORF Transcript_3458/g.5882 Transcript_3458/m.5882 type:complete len:95 (+) Transcript_3458:541-825(+)